MRLIGLSLSDHTIVTPENPLGWAPWVRNEDQTDARLLACEAMVNAGRFSGVYLSGACGKLGHARPCGRYPSGDTAFTYWAGHDDGTIHPIVERFADLVPTYASIGFPVTMNGLDALRDDIHQYEGVGFILDVSGSNTSERVVACAAVVSDSLNDVLYESRPIGEPVYADCRYATMSARARAIMQNGGDLEDDIIVYTGGDNRWLDAEARVHESQGRVVVQPWGSIPLDGGSGGSA